MQIIGLKKWALLLFACVVLTGCAGIPENAALLSEKINAGITRMHEENAKVITALADVERAILDEHWEQLYAKVEQQYMQKMTIADASAFSQNDRRAITATAATARQDILNDINAKESELLAKSARNRDTVISINNEIRRYLVSLEKLDAARENTKALLSDIVGVDLSSMKGLVKGKLSSL